MDKYERVLESGADFRTRLHSISPEEYATKQQA